MPIRRFKEDAGRSAVYHCFTRSVNGEQLFDDVAREFLRLQLWKVAYFSGVNILTYCLMSNHFHVLVEVPPGRVPVEDAELIRRYRTLYPKGDRQGRLGLPSVLEERLAAGGEQAAQIRQRLHKRMGDISAFVGLLKQRFSVWFNKTHQRFGTLWAERFQSVLVEGEQESLGSLTGAWQMVAAYIDLNPVRAGLVTQPEAYRWSGHGEAVGGSSLARAGIVRLMGKPWKQALGEYRSLLYGRGSAPAAEGASLDVQTAQTVLARQGEMSPQEALLHRVRYFSQGLALGSQRYVERQLDRYRKLTNRRRRCKPRRWVLGRGTPAAVEFFVIQGKSKKNANLGDRSTA